MPHANNRMARARTRKRLFRAKSTSPRIIGWGSADFNLEPSARETPCIFQAVAAIFFHSKFRPFVAAHCIVRSERPIFRLEVAYLSVVTLPKESLLLYN